MAKNPFTTESVEFDTPANRVISEFAPKNKFEINTSLPDLAFMRQLSVQGRLRYFNESVAPTGTTTIIPPTGETFFFGGLVAQAAGNAGSITITNDGNIRAAMICSATANGGIQIFSNFIDSLVGNGLKTFTVTVANTDIIYSLWGWVENTARIRDVAA